MVFSEYTSHHHGQSTSWLWVFVLLQGAGLLRLHSHYQVEVIQIWFSALMRHGSDVFMAVWTQKSNLLKSVTFMQDAKMDMRPICGHATWMRTARSEVMWLSAYTQALSAVFFSSMAKQRWRKASIATKPEKAGHLAFFTFLNWSRTADKLLAVLQSKTWCTL